MTAETIARALDGHRVGAGWMARCPAHDDHDPSLSIRDTHHNTVLFRCRAGCEQTDVLAGLRVLGLWETTRKDAGRVARKHQCRVPAISDSDDRKRTESAVALWEPLPGTDGTLVETYLLWRKLTLAIPPELRSHTGLKHRSGGVWPALVARVTHGVTGKPIAIHRTFLARDGHGKAPVDPERMMLGPCRGGVVRLAEPGDVLMVGEGIETCLSAMQATGLPAWAALSTSGLRSLDLPDDVRDVVVLADGDDAGETAAQSCARRWSREGRFVRIARPPRGMDFNDMLMGTASSSKGDKR